MYGQLGERKQYPFFGLVLDVPVEIPGLAASTGVCAGPVIRVDFGPVPASLKNVIAQHERAQISCTEYLLLVPGVLAMYVEGSDRVTVELAEGADQQQCWHLLLGAIPSIVGMRLGWLPLHASLAASGDRCAAFTGQSGAGKSTMLASLVQLGFTQQADDLCLVQPGPSGDFMVGTGPPELKLCVDAIEAVAWSRDADFLYLPEAAKRLYGMTRNYEERRLTGIYMLEFGSTDESCGIFQVHGFHAVQELLNNLRVGEASWKGMADAAMLKILTDVAARVPIYRFVRPRNKDRLMDWSRRLAEHIATQEHMATNERSQ